MVLYGSISADMYLLILQVVMCSQRNMCNKRNYWIMGAKTEIAWEYSKAGERFAQLEIREKNCGNVVSLD